MKTRKPDAVHVDRLIGALAAQGIDVRRTKALQLVAAAFGFHNTHECTAASKRGDFTPPAALPVCRIEIPGGETLIVLRDPVSDAPYAIDGTFVEEVVENERREAYGPSPYGRLLDLSSVAVHPATAWRRADAGSLTTGSGEGTLRLLVEVRTDGPVTAATVRDSIHNAIAFQRAENGLSADDDEGMVGEISTRLLTCGTTLDTDEGLTGSRLGQVVRESGRESIHVALIHHGHGVDVRLGTTLANVSRQVADHARENWDEAWTNDQAADRRHRIGLPENCDGLDDDEAERMYFAAMSLSDAVDYVEYSTVELDGEGPSSASNVTAVIEAANSRCVPREEPFPGIPANLYTVNASRDGHVFVETFRIDEDENEEDKGRELAAGAFGVDLDAYREPVHDGDDGDYPNLADEERAEMAAAAEDAAKDERNQNFDADIDSIEIEKASIDDMLLPILEASWAAAQKLPAWDPLRDVIRRQVMDAIPHPRGK